MEEENGKGQDVWAHVERLHRRHISKGEDVIRHMLATFSGEIKNPVYPGAKSVYGIVNGVRVELPTHVNVGDAVSLVAVMEMSGYEEMLEMDRLEKELIDAVSQLESESMKILLSLVRRLEHLEAIRGVGINL